MREVASKPIFHWVYVSTVVEGFNEHDLQALLRTARMRNASREISGLLMHADNRFMQILEGSRENVEALSNIIIKDPRHQNINTLRFEHKRHRDFADWTMGFIRPKDGLDPDGFLPLLDDFFLCPYAT